MKLVKMDIGVGGWSNNSDLTLIEARVVPEVGAPPCTPPPQKKMAKIYMDFGPCIGYPHEPRQYAALSNLKSWNRPYIGASGPGALQNGGLKILHIMFSLAIKCSISLHL